MPTQEKLNKPIEAVREMIRERYEFVSHFAMTAPVKPTPLSQRIIRDALYRFERHERWPEAQVMAAIVLYLAEALDESEKRLDDFILQKETHTGFHFLIPPDTPMIAELLAGQRRVIDTASGAEQTTANPDAGLIDELRTAVTKPTREDFLAMTREHPGAYGICHQCGCTEVDGCKYNKDGETIPLCTWVDEQHTLCSNPECLERQAIQDAAAAKTKQDRIAERENGDPRGYFSQELIRSLKANCTPQKASEKDTEATEAEKPLKFFVQDSAEDSSQGKFRVAFKSETTGQEQPTPQVDAIPISNGFEEWWESTEYGARNGNRVIFLKEAKAIASYAWSRAIAARK